MQHFLQSPLRKNIKTLVYGEEFFETSLFDEPYFWLIKRKSFWPLSVSWLQILGVKLPSDEWQIREEIKKIKQDYGKNYGNLFVQLWIINELDCFDNIWPRPDEFWTSQHFQREELQQQLDLQASLVPSFRENMPLSTILIDTKKTDEEFLEGMNSWSANHVRKALKKDIDFHPASTSDYENFYHQRRTISQQKWFSIISKTAFDRLMEYLITNQCGNLFIATKDDIMLWGSIVVYQNNTLTYLYGFSNRHEQFRNLGVHHFMRYKLFSRARDAGFGQVDMFGGAPSGYPDHDLVGVSKFKESLGGQKIDYYGNYDIILNKPLYHLSKGIYQRKK